MFFNVWFSQDKTTDQIKSALHNRRIVCGRKGKDRKIRRRRLFTAEQEEYLRQQYRDMPVSALTAAFNAEFCQEITENQIRCFIRNHRIKSGRTGCFEPGNAPWNTGTKGATGRNKTSFGNGNVPPNVKPIGSERIGKDGYVEIKVAEINPYTGYWGRWRQKHVYLWEKMHGPVPDGMVVFFRDGDNNNFDLGNLGSISRTELLVMNLHGYAQTPAELKPVILALAKLEVKAGVRTKPGRGRRPDGL